MFFVQYMDIKRKMTDSCNMSCLKCPLHPENSGEELSCDRLELLKPEVALEIVQKWYDSYKFRR